MAELQSIADRLFWLDSKLLTQNAVPGKPFFGEKKENVNGVEYRVWNPYHSKLAAALHNGLKEFPIRDGSKVLYLGVAEGKTASYISDIVGAKGLIVGVDLSAFAISKFTALCDVRRNMVPLLADANLPDSMAQDLNGIPFDVLFQDVSQKNQAEIFLKNADRFLKPRGFGLLSIKSQSINSLQDPQLTFAHEKALLETQFSVLQTVSLEPFEKGHALFYCQKTQG